MPKTISFHNGTTWSRGHNIRDERYTDKQEHIDKALSDQNVTVRDVPVRQAYAEIFGQAVEEYNAKQKRSDRRINERTLSMSVSSRSVTGMTPAMLPSLKSKR